MNLWINVKDNLPSERELVLAAIVAPHPDGRIWRGITTAYFTRNNGWIAPWTGEHVDVRFWQPVMEFPEELKNIGEK